MRRRFLWIFFAMTLVLSFWGLLIETAFAGEPPNPTQWTADSTHPDQDSGPKRKTLGVATQPVPQAPADSSSFVVEEERGDSSSVSVESDD